MKAAGSVRSASLSSRTRHDSKDQNVSVNQTTPYMQEDC
jgi:hypothetical protein